MSTVDDLARQVWEHVPDQPWSRYGDKPVPVEMSFGENGWGVKFVVVVKGERRVWGHLYGQPSLEAALRTARAWQRQGRRPR